MDAALKTYDSVARQEFVERLIESHLIYVKRIVGRMVIDFPTDIDRENLEGAGILGLVEAAHRFRVEQGVPFRTYAYQRIRGAILDELRRNCPLPQEVLADWAKISRCWHELKVPVTTIALSQQSGLSVKRVEECLLAIRSLRPDSWNSDLSPPIAEQSVEDKLVREDQAEILAHAIEQLPEQERTVITLYYYKELTLREIGEVVELSESRISRILAQTEIKLKQMVQSGRSKVSNSTSPPPSQKTDR